MISFRLSIYITLISPVIVLKQVIGARVGVANAIRDSIEQRMI